jgi:predicted ABC-type ATPase
MLKKKPPLCVVIAGPNGAGKTTFAREFLPAHHGIIHFVNADLVAGGLSPLRPQLAARAAGRLVLAELGRLGKERKDFAFETTLSGLGYARLLRGLKAKGYRLEMVYLQIESPQLARRRIAARVKQGGMMFRSKTSNDDLRAVGGISSHSTVPWPIVGRCSITRAAHHNSSTNIHENKTPLQKHS